MKSSLSEACTIKINNFEGPFDLLFHLIEKNKMSIHDIQIAQITDQYIEYLSAMQQLDLDIASEFLIVAATLMHIKSRSLLPKEKSQKPELEENEIDPKEQLILKLVQYKKIKQIAEDLKQREIKYEKMYYRNFACPILLEENVSYIPLTLNMLNNSYHKLMQEFKLRLKCENISVKDNIGIIIKRENFSVKVKMQHILRTLKTKVCICFSELSKSKKICKPERIAIFLAVLELVKLRKIKLSQENTFSEIFISLTKSF